MSICVSNRDTECPCILHKIFTMTLKNPSLNSDFLGAFASGLCLIHCIATPFLFVAQAAAHHDHHHHGASPGWWLIDSAFLIISLLAVYWTARNTSKQWMKIALAASWLFLAASRYPRSVSPGRPPQLLFHSPDTSDLLKKIGFGSIPCWPMQSITKHSIP